MFLAFIIPAFLSPCFVPTAECEIVKSKLNLTDFGNGSFAYQDIIFSPFSTAEPISKLYLLQTQFPDLLFSPKSYDLASIEYKNGTRKGSTHKSEFRKRHAPVRVPRVRSSKDYGQSAHYRMKGSKDSSRKHFYMSLLQKLLRPATSRKGKDYYTSSKYSSPPSAYYTQVSSAPSMEAAAGGWGWSKGHGGGGYHGVSLVDLLLCGLSLLSLGGFLLNLLLNLLNMFGMGMFTTTATYPVTVTATQTGTATGTATGGTNGGTAITYPTVITSSAVATGADWGFTGRTIDSMAGKGWGRDEWKGSKGKGGKGGKGGGNGWAGSNAYLKGHFKFGGSKGGWPSTTTTTTTTTAPTLPPTATYPTYPTLTGTGGFANSGRKKRKKRESFQPYVNPTTALNSFSKAILNSISAANNKYECMEKIFCENNKQARVIGNWLDYFMPVYSFSLSYFGHRVGAHESLVDHIRAIVLGVAETNCQAHFPRCGEPTHT